MKSMIHLVVALSALFILAPVQAGAIYKWVDQEGITHYDEQPPVNVKYTTVKTYGSHPSGAKAATEQAETQRENQSEAGKKGVDYEHNKKISEENAKVAAENCKNAQDNLKTMEENARVRILDEKGEYRYLTEEEKQSQMKQAQDVIEKNCKT
jgi:thiol:disulfide interchange protein